MDDKILLLWLLHLISVCIYYSTTNLYIRFRRIFFRLCVFVWCGFVWLCLSTLFPSQKRCCQTENCFKQGLSQKARTISKKRKLFQRSENCFTKPWTVSENLKLPPKKGELSPNNENCFMKTSTVLKNESCTRKQELFQKPKTV